MKKFGLLLIQLMLTTNVVAMNMSVEQLFTNLKNSKTSAFDEIKKYLDGGGDVNIRNNKKDETLLTLAVDRNNKQVIEQLLSFKADVNKVNCEWFLETPLLRAATLGNKDIVEMLLKAGANVDQANSGEQTPLISAAKAGHTAVVEMLLKAGANINKADKNGQTPLILAALKGAIDVVDMLLKAGADVNKADRVLATPLSSASYSGHKDVVAMLLQAGARVDAADGHNQTSLFDAVRYSRKDVVVLLVNAGADINMHNNEGDTPYSIASRLYQVAISKNLVSEEILKRKAIMDLLSKEVPQHKEKKEEPLSQKLGDLKNSVGQINDLVKKVQEKLVSLKEALAKA